jgi:hypothetical protein
MSTPVPLRSDFDTIGLRMLARRSRDPDQTRRLLALAEIYDGGSRPDAARIGGAFPIRMFLVDQRLPGG